MDGDSEPLPLFHRGRLVADFIFVLVILVHFGLIFLLRVFFRGRVILPNRGVHIAFQPEKVFFLSGRDGCFRKRGGQFLLQRGLGWFFFLHGLGLLRQAAPRAVDWAKLAKPQHSCS